ncbi:hypothetical protein [Streptomyces sp. NPDC088246]|uniref:hypothetical protein n=1 Tax=Streptomyces sp. NPDC088246 TaxID=3365842 RepID=UPI00382CC5B4
MTQARAVRLLVRTHSDRVAQHGREQRGLPVDGGPLFLAGPALRAQRQARTGRRA